jgi:hypothetical protein
MMCNSPIDITTDTAKNDSNALICNYYAGDATFNINSKTAIIKYGDTDSPSNIKYKGMTYMLKRINIYKKSVHSINGRFSVAEMVMIHLNKATQQMVCICIPITLTIKQESSFGTLLSSVSSTVHNFESPKIFVPSGVFYSYTAPLFFQCNSPIKNEYIVFASSNVFITQSELDNIPTQSFEISQTDTFIFKHSRQSVAGKTLSFNDDKVYIDCQPIDATESSTSESKTTSSSQPSSIKFSEMKNNQFIKMLFMFIVIMIVLVIFFYSYEFTTGMFRELTNSVASKMNNL